MKYYIYTLITLCLFSVTTQAQQAIDYKDVIDYYRQSVKSTVLMRKDCTFLKDGFYIFKGTIEDFDFVVHNLLQVPNETDLFMPNDSVELFGEICDSVKVGVWDIKLIRNSQKIDFVYYYYYIEAGDIIKAVGLNFWHAGDDGMWHKFVNIGTKHIGWRGIQNTYTLPKDLKVSYNTCAFYSEHTNDYSFRIRRTDSLNNTIYREETYSHENLFFDGRKATMKYFNKEGTLLKGKFIVRPGKEKDGSNIVNTEISIEQEKNKLNISITETIKDNKLIKLEIQDNSENNPFFREMLPVNYFPVILYEKTKFWIK